MRARPRRERGLGHLANVRVLEARIDRACEIEADGYAVKLLKDSGADPATLLGYLRTLPQQQNKEMSVYPAPAERIESAQTRIAALGR